MCVPSAQCVLAQNASHPYPDGQNSPCLCNPGFVATITLQNVSPVSNKFVFSCNCPTGFTITSAKVEGVSTNACCPPNSNINIWNG